MLRTDRYRRALWTIVLVVALSTPGVVPPVSASPIDGIEASATSEVDATTVRAQGGGFELWMTNQRRNSIQVVRDETLIEEIDLGGLRRVPHIVRFSPSGRFAYLASVGLAGDVASPSTMVLRTADRTVAATFPTGPGSHEASPSPDGERLVVAVGGLKMLTEIVVDETAESFTLGRRARGRHASAGDGGRPGGSSRSARTSTPPGRRTSGSTTAGRPCSTSMRLI